MLNALSKFWQTWDSTKKPPAGFINDIAKMLQVEHKHPKFLRLLLDLQEIQVKRFGELSFSLLFMKRFPRVLPLFNYALSSVCGLF